MAVKLKRLSFLCTRPGVGWVTETLQTVESKDLQEITLQTDHVALMRGIEEWVLQEWEDLDRLLFRFWTSHSIRLKVMYRAVVGREGIRGRMTILLPELTRSGIVDLVENQH